jgi:hypothetical protein
MRSDIRIPLALIVSVLAGTARAVPVSVTFEGTIGRHDVLPWPGPDFAIGQRFVGQYVFESTTPGNKSATEFGGIPPERTPYPGALLSFTATSGGTTLTSSGAIQNGILIDDNFERMDDYFVVLSSEESELYLDLRSTDTGLFTSQALPLTLPPASAFDKYAFFRVRIGPGSYAQGDIDRIEVVPEPVALGMIFLAAAPLLRRARRRVSRRDSL